MQQRLKLHNISWHHMRAIGARPSAVMLVVLRPQYIITDKMINCLLTGPGGVAPEPNTVQDRICVRVCNSTSLTTCYVYKIAAFKSACLNGFKRLYAGCACCSVGHPRHKAPQTPTPRVSCA